MSGKIKLNQRVFSENPIQRKVDSPVYEAKILSNSNSPKMLRKDATDIPRSHPHTITKTQASLSSGISNAENMEKFLGNLLHEIYLFLQDSKKARSQFKPIALAQEMGYINNIYRYILFARAESFQNVNKLHKIFIEILEGITRQSQPLSAKLEEYKKKWDDWNISLKKQSPTSDISLTVLPVLNAKYGIRQWNNFHEMLEDLKKNTVEILDKQKALLEFPAFQEIANTLKTFQYKLEFFKSCVYKFKIEETHPHIWLKECLESIQDLFEKALACFIFMPREFWLQIEKFWDIVFEHYRVLWNFASPESEIGTQRPSTQTLKALSITSQLQGYWSFSSSSTFNKIFWKPKIFGHTKEIGFNIERREWQRIPLPEALSLSLRKLCELCETNKDEFGVCFYESILHHFTFSCTALDAVLQRIVPAERERFVKNLIRLYGESLQSLLQDMQPLLDWLEIEILFPDPTNLLCQKDYDFGAGRQEAGYRIQKNIEKKPNYVYGILYPSCWETIQSLQEFFLTRAKWHDAFFWYKANLYKAQGNLQSLFAEFREILKNLDQEIYTEESKTPEDRKKYEDLLWQLQEALHNDGYTISFAAGSYDQARKSFPDVRYEFNPRNLQGQTIPGYPMDVRERPFASATAGNIIYCRGDRPFILDFLKKQSFFTPHANQAAYGIAEQIEKEWPYNKNTIAREILDNLVKPLRENAQESSKAKENFYFIIMELQEAMKKDGLPGLFPNPAISGKIGQKKENGSYQIGQEEYFHFKEVFSDLPSMMVIEIEDFILQGDTPSQSLFKISAGPCPWGLDVFHKTMSHLSHWAREWESKRANASIPINWISNAQGLADDFALYAKDIVSPTQIQEQYYPKFLGSGLDLADLHRQFFLSHKEKSTLISGLFSLVQLLDTIVSLWYCEDSNPCNRMESLRKELAKDTLEILEQIQSNLPSQDAIFPIRIQDSISYFVPAWYSCTQEGTLAIRQRKFSNSKKDAVYPVESLDKVVLLQGTAPKENAALLEAMQNFFLNTWCLLQQESNALNRQTFLQTWERYYYAFHSSGGWQGILDIFNAFYKISEGLEKALGSYQKFCEWESRLNFLENHLKQIYGISKVFVKRGDLPEIKEEIKQNFQFQESPTKSLGMQYRHGGIIRVLKPAFVRNDRTRIQMGEALIQA